VKNGVTVRQKHTGTGIQEHEMNNKYRSRYKIMPVPEILNIVEGGLGRNAVDQDKALSILHVKIAHCRKLFRAYEVIVFSNSSNS
jgi:hypothetical protein